MQIKKRNSFLIGILILFLLLFTVQPSSQAFLFRSNWNSGPVPTIDGLVQAGEWDDAYDNTIYCNDVFTPSTQIALTLYAMNDRSNLYLLADWTDSTHNSNYDAIFIFFDEDHDNNYAESSDNAVRILINNPGVTYVEYNDGHGAYPFSEDTNTTDGEGAATWASITYQVEFRIPLTASDSEDLQTGAGEMIGIAILIVDDTSNYEYPFYAAILSYSNPFQLAASPFIGTSTLLLALLIIGLIALFMTWKKYSTKFQSINHF
ncbi:MAG: sugar-binding protein [Promethearchaeota archaeon]